ncbi:flagellar filament capping protein FliD [Thaumasiovibrio subtropicus]|uniref:flagellar filament capping protein FliD n=1 Tax=Thaumasiovibrio subtropicus TaxID=1891207 RepID=UPI000B361E1C|nr:flagellar filament capping protein FliD [Thaumasiovibrio subtropicus]
MAIQMSGLASGMDINGMVDKLVQAEKAPKQERIDRQMGDIQTDISAYGRLKESLDTMKSLMSDFRNNDALAARRADVDNSDQISVSATSSAAVGRYSVDVQQLATSHKIVSNSIDESTNFGAGSLRIGLGTTSFNVDIEPGNDKLIDIVRQINRAPDNPGIMASVIQDDLGARLVLSGDKTGASNKVRVSVDADPASDLQRFSFNASNASNPMNEMQQALDSRVVLDGLAVITSDSNQVKDAIEGVDLELKALSEGEPSTLSVSYDRDTTRMALEQFVMAYNQYFSVTQELSKYDPATQSGGPLMGDSLVRSSTNQLREAFVSPVEEAPEGLKTLSQLGITTTLEGRLEIDYDVLDRQLNQNFAGLNDFFGGRNGFARRVEDLIHSYTGITGSIRSRENSLNEQQTRLLTEQTKLDDRIESVRKRTYDQFSAMDSAMGQMNSQLTYMQSMFPTGNGGQ